MPYDIPHGESTAIAAIASNRRLQRSDRWYISQVYLVIALVIMVLALIFSKASKKDRLVAASFAAIPLLNQVITRYTFGISTQYAAMLVSIVLIYGVLFAEREKTIASTEMEFNRPRDTVMLQSSKESPAGTKAMSTYLTGGKAFIRAYVRSKRHSA